MYCFFLAVAWWLLLIDLVQVYVSIQGSGKPIEHFLVDDQFEFHE